MSEFKTESVSDTSTSTSTSTLTPTSISTSPLQLSQPVIIPDILNNLLELKVGYHFKFKQFDFLIPAGFKFSCSIPPGLWEITYSPFDPVVILPSLIHDYIYTFKLYSRLEADELFKDLLLLNNCDKFKVDLMYNGVRVFGSSHYGNSKFDQFNYDLKNS